MALSRVGVGVRVRELTVDRGLITLEPKDIAYENGKHIWIQIKGCEGNESDPLEGRTQIMLEYYEGRIKVHVWNQTQEAKTTEINLRPEYEQVLNAKKKQLPTLIHVTDPDAKELLNRRLKRGI